MDKKIISLVVGGVVLAGISFYAGSQYANSKNQSALSQNTNSALRSGNLGTRGGSRGGGSLNGQIVAKDATSFTVELRSVGQNGGTAQVAGTPVPQGSKIVFYTGQTNITKTVNGKITDLTVGEQVNVVGTANTDGSVTAQSVQIRPAMPVTPTTTPVPAQ